MRLLLLQFIAMLSVLILLFFVEQNNCMLWPKGVIHFTINKKDYDVHSQDVISDTFVAIQKEVCVKFFDTPQNFSTDKQKILYISNSEKKKSCPPEHYDYSKRVIDMVIGYKCLNPRDIARIVVDVLRDSIEQSVPTVNSYDLIKKFQERDKGNATSLLSPNDRNYVNAHYNRECGSLEQKGHGARRMETSNDVLSSDNIEYYEDKLWPLGIVMYGVENTLRDSQSHSQLKYAMATIEMSTCLVFQENDSGDQVLNPKNLLWFGTEGEAMPQLGFTEGNQTLNLNEFTSGAPGHSAHVINNLLRAVGVPMMSNRFDRDNYVNVNWKHVTKGKEIYLEKTPEEAWVQALPYDFDSATHAPANYMCADCELGAQTVQPVQDHLWQRTMNMGHKTALSDQDGQLISYLYTKECNSRFIPN